MSIKVIRYRLPSYWACPLINDDYTGLTDEECEEIQRFLEAAEGLVMPHGFTSPTAATTVSTIGE